MFNILPLINKIFRNDPLTKALSRGLSSQLEDINSGIESLSRNMFLSTSDWSLSILEKELGLKVDASKPLEQRLAIISSKLRGAGNLTLDLIQSTINAYIDGDVEVTFDGVINIKFKSIYGIPANMVDIYNAILEIKPAHLGVTYTFKYRTHKDLKSYSHKDLGKRTHLALREEGF